MFSPWSRSPRRPGASAKGIRKISPHTTRGRNGRRKVAAVKVEQERPPRGFVSVFALYASLLSADHPQGFAQTGTAPLDVGRHLAQSFSRFRRRIPERSHRFERLFVAGNSARPLLRARADLLAKLEDDFVGRLFSHSGYLGEICGVAGRYRVFQSLNIRQIEDSERGFGADPRDHQQKLEEMEVVLAFESIQVERSFSHREVCPKRSFLLRLQSCERLARRGDLIPDAPRRDYFGFRSPLHSFPVYTADHTDSLQ